MKRYWIPVFVGMVAMAIMQTAFAKNQPDWLKQLGIKRFPKTETEVLHYAALWFKQGCGSPNWSKVSKGLVKRTFKKAFGKDGKPRPEWVARFKKVLKSEGAGTLSDPIPPEKKGKPWQFRAHQGTEVINFTLSPTTDPVKVTSRYFIDFRPPSKPRDPVVHSTFTSPRRPPVNR